MMKEQSLVCVVQHYQYYAKMQKLRKMSVEISISFMLHSSKGACSARTPASGTGGSLLNYGAAALKCLFSELTKN